MEKPLFTVVIPALNEEKFLPNLLESLCAQTTKNFEVIVVDGSSTDKTVEVAKKFKSKLPLNIIVSKTACLPLQRNLGARNSSGEWLAFVDADSILLPNFFERVSKFIEKYQPKLLTTWARPDSEEISDAILTLLFNILMEQTMRLKKAYSPGPLTLVTRAAFTSINGYDESHAYNEDIDFGLRLQKIGIMNLVVRETLYVWSLRRMRKVGTFKVLQQYLISALPVLLFNKTYKKMPGYVMGGQLYGRNKKLVKSASLKSFELKLKKITQELLG
jgi:glycosyltransferase involved in cell wall biosynthesis